MGFACDIVGIEQRAPHMKLCCLGFSTMDSSPGSIEASSHVESDVGATSVGTSPGGQSVVSSSVYAPHISSLHSAVNCTENQPFPRAAVLRGAGQQVPTCPGSGVAEPL